jgi:ubiquitin C-terminal hydrolase
VTGEYEQDINRTNPIGSKGVLAEAYAELIGEIWNGTGRSISPWALKKTISKIAPRFAGIQQHDSQEFLCYLLDGLHEDLNRLKQKQVIESIDGYNKPDELVAAESWSNHLKRNQSIFVDLMHGQAKSTLTCPRLE